MAYTTDCCLQNACGGVFFIASPLHQGSVASIKRLNLRKPRWRSAWALCGGILVPAARAGGVPGLPGAIGHSLLARRSRAPTSYNRRCAVRLGGLLGSPSASAARRGGTAPREAFPRGATR